MNTTRTKCPKFLATLATIAISTASPAFAETGDVENDEDARQLKLLFQELAIDPEDLTRDSLNKDLIDTPDRYRNSDFASDLLNRDVFSNLGDFAPSLDRNRPGFETGIGGKAVEGIEGRRDGTLYRVILFEVNGKTVAIFVLDDDEVGNRSTDDLDIDYGYYFHSGKGEFPSTWIRKSTLEKDADDGGRERVESTLETWADARLAEEEEDKERGALGGNDNDDHGGKAGSLNEFRPLSDGTNGTIRFGKSEPKGGDLEGEPGSSNSAFATLRFAPGTEEKIKSSRVDDYNAGVIAFLNEIMNGGGGFDPSGWDDTENGDGLGEIQGNIGGGSL